MHEIKLPLFRKIDIAAGYTTALQRLSGHFPHVSRTFARRREVLSTFLHKLKYLFLFYFRISGIFGYSTYIKSHLTFSSAECVYFWRNCT